MEMTDTLIIILIIVSGFLFHESLTNEIYISVQKCLGTVIPSLYAPMFIACLVTESRFHMVIGKILSLPARYIFRMPPEIFSIFLLSNVSGYPTGAKLLKNMLDAGEITKNEFDRYCSCCYSAGPAFVTGTATVLLSGSVSSGTLIFIANLTANMITAYMQGKKHPVPPRTIIKIRCTVKCSDILRAADSASRGMLQMCSVITAFSVFRTMLVQSGTAHLISSAISGISGLKEEQSTATVLSLLEITNISELQGTTAEVMSLMAALFSSGGICVIMQVFSIAGNSLNRMHFLRSRFFSAVYSYAIFRVMYIFFYSDAAVAASSFFIHTPDKPLLPSVLIILMSIMLISTDKCLDKT
jgi:hypothetical protein